MKILKNLKKFEHLVWFALICLTGNVTDVILNQVSDNHFVNIGAIMFNVL